MITIHKFELKIADEQEIQTHQGAEILAFQTTVLVPYVWVKVDTENPKEIKKLYIIGTGNDVRMGLTYVGTIQLRGFVWHLFK